MLLRLPPNTKIQAHSHKDDRTAVVLSGVWYFGYGREFNEAALKELPAGSFLYGAARHRALRDDERPGNDNRNYGIRTIRHRVRRRKTRPGEKVDRSRPASQDGQLLTTGIAMPRIRQKRLGHNRAAPVKCLSR